MVFCRLGPPNLSAILKLLGQVDSEDLPLNVGREILQRSKMLSVISKRLVRKSLDMFKDLTKDPEKYKTFCECSHLEVCGFVSVVT